MINKTSFYTSEELANVGFKSYGDNVLISRYARFYHPERISHIYQFYCRNSNIPCVR